VRTLQPQLSIHALLAQPGFPGNFFRPLARTLQPQLSIHALLAQPGCASGNKNKKLAWSASGNKNKKLSWSQDSNTGSATSSKWLNTIKPHKCL
jgi:hypothetical protein